MAESVDSIVGSAESLVVQDCARFVVRTARATEFLGREIANGIAGLRNEANYGSGSAPACVVQSR